MDTFDENDTVDRKPALPLPLAFPPLEQPQEWLTLSAQAQAEAQEKSKLRQAYDNAINDAHKQFQIGLDTIQHDFAQRNEVCIRECLAYCPVKIGDIIVQKRNDDSTPLAFYYFVVETVRLEAHDAGMVQRQVVNNTLQLRNFFVTASQISVCGKRRKYANNYERPLSHFVGKLPPDHPVMRRFIKAEIRRRLLGQHIQ